MFNASIVAFYVYFFLILIVIAVIDFWKIKFNSSNLLLFVFILIINFLEGYCIPMYLNTTDLKFNVYYIYT